MGHYVMGASGVMGYSRRSGILLNEEEKRKWEEGKEKERESGLVQF